MNQKIPKVSPFFRLPIHTCTRVLSSVSFVLIMLSCTKELPIPGNIETGKLVVSSLFCAGKPIKIFISSTVPINEPIMPFGDNARCIIRENGIVLLDTVMMTTELETSIYPRYRGVYDIEVHTNRFPTVFARDSIPDPVPIREAYFRFPAGIDSYGDKYTEASITFLDPPGERNYYELTIYNTESFWWGFNELKNTDPVLLNEGDEAYFPSSYYFSDEIIDGLEYTLRIKQQVGSSLKFKATLRSTSRDYYLFRKSLAKHLFNQQLQDDVPDQVLFKGEPQSMHSNIKNGAGVFAGYSESSFYLQPY